MSRVLYYLILLPLSRLPFFVLYRISDLLYFFVYYLPGYRKNIVFQNLAGAFPNKTAAERKRIAKAFYRHLCDLFVETIKVFGLSEREAKRRFVFTNPEILRPYALRGQNILLLSGHYNNWEMGGIMANLLGGFRFYVVITPIKDAFLNRKFQSSRAKFGVSLVPSSALRAILSSEGRRARALVLLADQSPTYSRRVLWSDFLGRRTAVNLGPERIAKKYNYPVFWVNVRKVKRGYYEASIELVSDQSAGSEDGQITKLHLECLEKQILAQPAYWLWTHRRWKRVV